MAHLTIDSPDNLGNRVAELARLQGTSPENLLEDSYEAGLAGLGADDVPLDLLAGPQGTNEALALLATVDDQLRLLSCQGEDTQDFLRFSNRVPKGSSDLRRRTNQFAILVAVTMASGIFLGAQDNPNPRASKSSGGEDWVNIEPVVSEEAVGEAVAPTDGQSELIRDAVGSVAAPADAQTPTEIAIQEVANQETTQPTIELAANGLDVEALRPPVNGFPERAENITERPRTRHPVGGEPNPGYHIGPGDVISVKFHGQPNLDRPDLTVAPDGTIAYLGATQVDVAGLTIPEVRHRLEERLSEDHRDPRLIVSPQQLDSKKFTILGMVNGNGVFTLRKRTRLLEALALSGGIATRSGSAVGSADLAVDFRRSFLVRHGQKLEVDFERLYLHGDLTDNLLIQDGDYIYLASNARNRCYALGAVNGVRAVPIASGMTVMSVISAAGGYSPAAWKKRVLLVRGSLSSPEVVTVNTADILKGKAVDVQVEPGDLIYVHTRPFIRTTRLADTAIKAFIRGAVAGSIDDQVGVGF